MHGRKRTWMTKRKYGGPETGRWCQHAQMPRKRNVATYSRAIGKGHVRIISYAQMELKTRMLRL